MYLPLWQTSPFVKEGLVNNNLLRYENTSDYLHTVMDSGHAVLGAFFDAAPGDMNSSNVETALLAHLRTAKGGVNAEYLGDPMSNLYIPIFETLAGPTMNKVVGVLKAMIHWKSYFRDVLPDGVQPVVVVLGYQCNDVNRGLLDGTGRSGRIRSATTEQQCHESNRKNRRTGTIDHLYHH